MKKSNRKRLETDVGRFFEYFDKLPDNVTLGEIRAPSRKNKHRYQPFGLRLAIMMMRGTYNDEW